MCCLLMEGATWGRAADISEAEKLFRAGRYDECLRIAIDELEKDANREAWWILKIRTEVIRGKYEVAGQALEDARTRFPSDLILPLIGYEIYRTSGREKDSQAVVEWIEKEIKDRVRYTPAERIAIGRFLLARGKDAKEILDQYYSPITKKNPEFLEAYLAVAELALSKNDRAFAAETLQKAPKESNQDPRYHLLLAKAFAYDDRPSSSKSLNDALTINPHHVDSLLLQVDQLIDQEDFAAGEKIIQKILEVDPKEPRAWAYQAVIAHLREDSAGEKAARETALSRWAANPEVDYLIGKKLSQDYRFSEGSSYQRKSLEKDKNYLPAKFQLCQDLLRLGEEAEGWKLATEVFAADGYNVVAHNLVTLRDQLSNYRTMAQDGFILRMDAKEADLYGNKALEVLRKSRTKLTKKYDVKLNRAIIVEIFPRKQDFAVRTFGVPGADGYLGVCFGLVITANSPASQGKNPSNWEAVLWHEFCHTVTLHKTRNKMPRWLSEGISVYEEMQENPSWGQWLNPTYREMILGKDLTPLSQLSSAFLNAKSALHIQFAYFESAMAIEFLIERFKFDTLKTLLDDLGAGLPINEALQRRTGKSLVQLDKDFAEFAQAKGKAIAQDATWEKFDLPENANSTSIQKWLEKHPKNFWGLQQLAVRFIREQKWSEAEKNLQELRMLYPTYIGSNNAYELLATVYQKTSQPKKETEILEELAKRDGDGLSTYNRLIELNEVSKDWPSMAQNARRWLAVNPLIPAPHRFLARASEELKERHQAIHAYQTVLRFGVPDTADIHYRLAVLHDQLGEKDKARREVLQSLEDAPRSRDAHRLLLKLVESSSDPLPTLPLPREKKP
jgi:predicted Zn-dependent protease